MALTLAVVFFAAFVANVIVGSIGNAPIVGDVGEMLLLLAASASFVVGILKREALEKKRKNS